MLATHNATNPTIVDPLIPGSGQTIPRWEMAILFCWQFVLLFVLPAFGHVLPICIGQNILVNESIYFMPFILFFVRMLDIFHSITNEWAKFDTKDMFFFYFFSHASPTSTT
jgi:hypothetical protein